MPDDNQLVTPTQPVTDTPVTPLATPPVESSSEPAAPVVADTQPIILSESDVAAEAPVITESAPKPADDEKKQLEQKVEVLTGEVEALTNKIENLVSNVKPSVELPAESPAVVHSSEVLPTELPSAKDQMAEDKAVSPLTEKAEVAPIVSEDAAKPNTIPMAAPAPTIPKPDLPLNDIYPSAHMPSAPAAPDPYKPRPTVEPLKESHDSILGTIGEVVGSIGLTILIVMALSPLYKGIFPTSVWDAVKLIGWLTTVASLFVGFVFSLFSPRKITLKALLFIGLLISVILFLGVDGSGVVTSKLDMYLGQYLVYFR